jgi:type I restriction enzyme, R subunit
MLRETSSKVKKVSGYFNNYYCDYSPENCLQLIERVGLLSEEQKMLKQSTIGVILDWTLRENVQVNLRLKVELLRKKYKYPRDKQQKETDTILDQTKLLCKD